MITPLLFVFLIILECCEVESRAEIVRKVGGLVHESRAVQEFISPEVLEAAGTRVTNSI
jgi:hypothetical protein